VLLSIILYRKGVTVYTSFMPSTAVAYLRVSTDKQADSGLGLEAQRASVTAAAARLGLELREVHVDAGVSGSLSIAGRPVLMAAVGTLRRGDVFLVAKRDRLGRDVILVAMIERLIAKRGARVVSAAGEGTDNEDPSNVLMRRLIDSFSEYERLIIGARTKSALAAKRARGERVSRFPPFGFAFGPASELVACTVEQEALGIVRECRAAGYTLQAIANELNRQGSTTRAGSAWKFEYVRNLFRGGLLVPAVASV
jgi:DNA invertase Pin-like site-specific DNA recombinase